MNELQTISNFHAKQSADLFKLITREEETPEERQERADYRRDEFLDDQICEAEQNAKL